MAKILIVEDDADNLELLSEFLGEHGFDIIDASNAEDAIALAISEVPALVLMDMQMPINSNSRTLDSNAGIYASRALRGDVKLAAVPIVALTGFDAGASALREGVADWNAVIHKPYDFPALLALVEKLLEG